MIAHHMPTKFNANQFNLDRKFSQNQLLMGKKQKKKFREEFEWFTVEILNELDQKSKF